MAEPTLNEVLDLMHEIAPLELAADWDNVGLLLRSDAGRKQVAKCLLTIDLTDAVVAEAEQFGADLVISYHPTIFRPVARLDAADPVHGRVVRALLAGFAVYSPHTALDAAPAGLADWLVEGAVDHSLSSHAWRRKARRGLSAMRYSITGGACRTNAGNTSHSKAQCSTQFSRVWSSASDG